MAFLINNLSMEKCWKILWTDLVLKVANKNVKSVVSHFSQYKVFSC
jgi:hypothetical protein